MDFFENRQDGHRIHGRDERGEDEHLDERDVKAVHSRQTASPQTQTDGNGVEEGPHNGKEKNRAQMIKERPIGHKIAGVQDDGRQHAEEEYGRRLW